MSELYINLIRKVHPDINPDLANAHTITCEINAHKHNESMLQLIGVKYGLIPRPDNFKPEPKPEPKVVFVVNVGMVVCVVQVVRHKYHSVYGIVVEKRLITRGKNHGLEEITFVATTGKVMTTILSNHVAAMKKADENSYNRAREIAIKELAIDLKPTYSDFVLMGLIPKCNYGGHKVKYKGATYTVVKTTAKYVYIRAFLSDKTIKVYPQSLDDKAYSE
jgi:hypothetical protein